MNPETIRQLQGNPVWKAFEHHVGEVINTLDTLDGITFTDPTASSIEGRGRQLAVEKLRLVLEPFGLVELSSGDAKEQTEKESGLL